MLEFEGPSLEALVLPHDLSATSSYATFPSVLGGICKICKLDKVVASVIEM